MTTTFSIYIVKQYSGMTLSSFDDKLIQFESIEDIIEELTTVNNSYHFRIHQNTTYIFFGDLDHYNKSIEIFFNLLKTFLETYYNLKFEDTDFKYTKNNKKEGSYHYSIPKWNLTTEKLKQIHVDFINANPTDFVYDLDNKTITCVDIKIYSEHWFRCPNQYKGNSKDISKHIIVNGNMIDFIIDYIPEYSININTITKKIIEIKSVITTPINKSRKKKTTPNTQLQPQPLSTIQDINNNTNLLEITTIPTNTTIIETTNVIHPELLSNTIFRSNLYKQLFEKCYKQKRFDDYDTWIAIGMAIKKIFPNDSDGLELFNYFSSKGQKYDGFDITSKKFNSFDKHNEKGYNVATIYYYAMEDNKPTAIDIISKNTLQLAPTDICSFIKLLAGNKFFYKVEGEVYKLYCYNGRYWEKDDIVLRSFISNELHEFLKYILVNVYWETVGREFQQYKNKIDKLKTISYKREIIETYKEYNTKRDINFDDKWWLFGFNNKVYDMKECVFRDYKPEDYITITTGYDYREPTEDEIDFVNKLLKQIMPIEVERETFLDILASGIDGRCPEKFIIYNGGGGNGKGVINDLMLKMMGNYGMLGNNNLLFENSKMGSNPEKANMHKKRYIVFREPPSNKKFENSIVKEITGGGNFSARGHFESETQKELNNTMICECNEKPLFKDKIMEAEIRRLIDIYFRASFTTDETLLDDTKYIYKADPYYKTTEFQESYKCVLFKIIADRHKIYYHTNSSIIKLSPSIISRTQSYLESCCDIVGWFKDTYTEDITKHITMKDIYEDFKNSETYLDLSRQKKENYSKIKFFDLLRTNIFFKKYYTDKLGIEKNIILKWYKPDIIIDIPDITNSDNS